MTPGGRPSWSWAVVPAYLALTLLLTWPLAREFNRAIPAVFGALDPLLQSFILGWDWQVLLADPGRLFHVPIFHPHVRALTFMDHLVGEAIVAWPIALATGRTAPAYNTLVVLSFVLSGWFTYRLARGLGLSRAAAFLGGLAFAFGPYRYANLGNLNQLQTQFLPLGLHLALRCYRRQGMMDLAAVLLVLVVQSWFGWYYFFHLALAVTCVVAYQAVRGRRPFERGKLTRVAAMGAVAAAAILPGLVPYWQEQQAMPAFRRTIGMTALWSADVMDYLRLHVESAWAAAWPGGSGAQGFWPGFLAVPLALVGLAARRWGQAGMFLVIGAVGWVLSLGPVLQLAGHRTIVPLPFAVCFFVVPGFSSMRAPSRFAVLVLLAAAVLAAVGYDRLRGMPWLAGGRRATLLFVVALAVGVIGARAVELPMTLVPHRADMPPVYAWLAAQPDTDPLLEIPMPKWVTDENPEHTRRQSWLLEHGHPRLDGVSGFVPPDYETLRLVMQGFPRPGALAAAARFGARWVIVHYGDYPPVVADSLAAAVAARPELVPAARFGTDAIYRLTAVGTAPASQINR